MKLDIKVAALTLSLFWGIFFMFLVGVANLVMPGYGQAFLELMASVYPGYTIDGSFGQVLVGTLYGIVDGAFVGAAFAWLYNWCSSCCGKQAPV